MATNVFKPRFVLFLPLLILGLLLFTEAAYFLCMLSGESDIRRADLIVAFDGRPERTREAYRLIEGNYASNLVVSPATERRLRILKDKYLPERPFAGIPEQRARTTLENAIFTQRIMADRRLDSAILVTSWDHMPRAYFLLRLLCLGTGIRIRTHEVATGRIDGSNWYRHKGGLKMVYNEMVELWGSLLEYAQYRIKGSLPEGAPGKSAFLGRMKKLLLFEIDDKSLHSARLVGAPVFVSQSAQSASRCRTLPMNNTSWKNTWTNS